MRAIALAMPATLWNLKLQHGHVDHGSVSVSHCCIGIDGWHSRLQRRPCQMLKLSAGRTLQKIRPPVATGSHVGMSALCPDIADGTWIGV
mmetsp:Transcript_143768/g.374463  ORF Transcript_143768/g.374463 Transcript_143768/m.374463 type:complete len:90 (+) Transcript_143768:2467-2736(+)